jgi:hypothetical protein
MTSYLLISAAVGDQVAGVEVSDPACPFDIGAHPDALAWAEGQGYGLDCPDELIYVQTVGEEQVPTGFATYRVEVGPSD